jgi:cytochrome c biogenesis protein ResB
VIEVTHDGEPIASGPVVCEQDRAPEGTSQLQLPWNCVVKLPTLRPQVAIAFTLWPDIRGLTSLLETGTSMPMLVKYDPLMTYVAYRGDLRTDGPTRTNELDTSLLERWKDGAIGAGETKALGEGLDVTFADLRNYTVLEVKRDRGLGWLLLAAILILVGLLPALYTSRRKVWVSAEAHGDGSVVRVGGFALQRREQFEEEFARLVERIAGAPEMSREREKVRT